MTTITPTKKTMPATRRLYPLVTPRERLLVWKNVKGMWKNRKPEPIQELKKIRKGWERKLPPLR